MDEANGGGEGVREAGNDGGRGVWGVGGGADGPRGKGMQDIAAPRDTRGRNLHDGAGDVLQFSQSSNHEVTRFPCMNGPFSLVCL